MARSSAVEKLSDKLYQIEEEIRTFRGEFEELTGEERRSSDKATPRAMLVSRIPAEVRKRLADEVFPSLSIQRRPLIGAEALQEMFRKTHLEPNEMSRDLIRMREE